ncbi:hypothetical protein R1sor_021514 [Riccia sorocarpa]|uniref:CCHC-type domain-containing protein n=1 Tax=Riccia sorocarpa TaxID=122646 RepID=A0ABD3GHB3_9MARC
MVSTVLYKELVDNDRGSTKLRAVIGTEIEEFPTTLEVPITVDFTIYVQLDYEDLHLRCFKCGSLDHKADECDSTTKAGDRTQTGGPVQVQTVGSEEDTSSSGVLLNSGKKVTPAEKTPQQKNVCTTRSQDLAGGGPTTAANSVQAAYRPPAVRGEQSTSTSKRKERSKSDSEEDIGHISKQLRSRGPVHKVYGSATKFTPAPFTKPLIQRGTVHHTEGKIVAEAAADGVHAAANPTVTAGKGGIALAISNRLAGLVTRSGSFDNRAVWVHIDGLKVGRVGILAVYAPNTVLERTRLWHSMLGKLESDRAWIVMGDFNMILEDRDQVGGSYSSIARAEREAWDAIAAELRLEDNFTRGPEEKWFSWDNQQRRKSTRSPEASDTGTEGTTNTAEEEGTGTRILKRLDRIYVSEEISRHQESYVILTSSNMSDHSPVYMGLLDGERKELQKARFSMNVSLLKDEEFRKQLIATWKETEEKGREKGDPLERTLRKCLREMCRGMKAQGKKKAKEKCAKWEEIRGRIRQHTYTLQTDPQSTTAQEKYQEAKDELDEMEKERAKWIQQRLDIRWMTNGDIPSKLFFGLFKTRQKQLEIECLEDDTGREVRGDEELCREA